jgi:hypothetical protein
VQPRPHRTTWTFWSYLSPSTAAAAAAGHPVQLLEHAAAGRLRCRPFADRRRLLSSSCRNQAEERAKQPAPPSPPTDTPAHAQTAGGGQLMASDGMRVTRRCPQTPLRPSQPPHPLAAAAAGRTHAQTAARTCWNRRRRWWLAASTGIRRLLRHRRPTKQLPQHA